MWRGYLVVLIMAGLWLPASAAAEDPPVQFTTTESLSASCAELVSPGLKVQVRNETASPQPGTTVRPVELIEKTTKSSTEPAEVCGGLEVEPAESFELAPAETKTVMIRGKSSEEESFSGNLVAFGSSGRVARLSFSVASKTAASSFKPLAEKQTAELADLDPTPAPIWIPVDGDYAKLPSKADTVLGVLTGENGAVEVTFSGDRRRLEGSTNLVGLKVSDLGVGSYAGKVDLLPDDAEKGEVEISLTVTTWWLWPLVLLILGIVVGTLALRQMGVKQPLAQLITRVETLRARYATARKELQQADGGGEERWRQFEIDDLEALRSKLIKRIESARREAWIKLDEEVLKDLKARVSALEIQVDLIGEIPEHAKALEKAIATLQQERPAICPRRPRASRDKSA